MSASDEQETTLPPTVPAGTTVGQLFRQLPEERVLESFEEVWPKAARRRESYRGALQEFRRTAGERTNLSCLVEMRLPDGAPRSAVPCVHVFVLEPDANGIPKRAPMLNMQIDWNKWSALDILLGPGAERIPRFELAAHIFWEMTWSGLQVENRDDRNESMMARVRKQDEGALDGRYSTILFTRWDA